MAVLNDLIVQGSSRFIGDLSLTRMNQLLVGTGTTGSSGKTGTTTYYYPAKWTYNANVEVSDGDMFTLKIPVAGHSYGVYASLNNGTDYYPIVCNGTGRLTTHYPVNTDICVVFESGGTAAGIYPYSGGTSSGTSAPGVFRVINYYDSNTTYTVVANTYSPYTVFKAAAAIYRYQILFHKDESTLLPMSTTNNSTATTKVLTTESFDPFGGIYYYNVTATTNSGAAITTGRTYQQILADLRYTFNTSSGLTKNKAIYVVAVPQSDGSAKLHSSPISQVLPTTDDGLIYIYLGCAYDTYRVALEICHPVYQYKYGQLRPYVGKTTNIIPAIHTATTYTSSTEITSDDSIVYALVVASGNLNNQVCPMTLSEGQMCDVIYMGSTTATTYTISISTTYKTPNGGLIPNITVPSDGYAEFSYIKINGTTFVRYL